eukprot:892986-Amphidinium_carterae.2
MSCNCKSDVQIEARRLWSTSKQPNKRIEMWLNASFVGHADASQDALSLADSEEPGAELMELFTELLKSDPDRSQMSSWCKRQSKVNSVDLRVLGQVVMMLNPMGSGDQHAVGMEVLRLMQRSELEGSVGIKSAVMEKSDAFVCQVFLKERISCVYFPPGVFEYSVLNF